MVDYVIMGKILSVGTRISQQFNAEERALKFISKNKKRNAAPLHKANLIEYEQIIKSNPKLSQKLNAKDFELDKRLKLVYVSSKSDYSGITSVEATTNEKILSEYDEERKETTREVIKLKSLLRFLEYHNENPSKYGAESLSSRFGLSLEKSQNILTYFKILQVRVNDSRLKKLPNRNVLSFQPILEGKRFLKKNHDE